MTVATLMEAVKDSSPVLLQEAIVEGLHAGMDGWTDESREVIEQYLRDICLYTLKAREPRDQRETADEFIHDLVGLDMMGDIMRDELIAYVEYLVWKRMSLKHPCVGIDSPHQDLEYASVRQAIAVLRDFAQYTNEQRHRTV